MFPSNTYIFSSILFLSLFLADYIHKCNYFSNRDKKVISSGTGNDGKDEVSGDLSILFVTAVKFIVLVLVIHFLSKLKCTKRTRLDDLLDKTKINLKKVHNKLDKCKSSNPDFPYDDEADEVRPMYLEVPILHVAIFDSCSRKDLVSEAGDSNSVYIT